jgi:hypothetical protein
MNHSKKWSKTVSNKPRLVAQIQNLEIFRILDLKKLSKTEEN